MMDKWTIHTERIDDIPLLIAQMERMGLPELLDHFFPTHGNWRGLSLGWVATIWLAHILSEGDHRLSHVQPSVAQLLQTLETCVGRPIRALDFSDDRLADILTALGQDEPWEAFEAALNQRLVRVYDLNPQRVRLDSTTASGYGRVTPNGLFQFGPSKDHRPDLPQVKVMLTTLDPLGMPLATAILPGHRADDPLYIPAVAQVRQSLGRSGLLYIGDCKMASLETRAFIQAGKDFYLCPLPEIQCPPEKIEAYLIPVWQGEEALISVLQEGEEAETVAEAVERRERLSAQVDGETVTWEERRLVMRSPKGAQAQEKALRARLARAQAALEALNQRKRGKRRFSDREGLRQAAEAIVLRYSVEGLLRLEYEEADKGPQVRVEVNEEALEKTLRLVGWRVYVTNAPVEVLSLAQAVQAYRSQYIIDRGMGRLKGRTLSLTPMYLQRDERVKGLIRLLSLGLRVLTLLEFAVRRALAAEGESLAGLYAGNPKRATVRPTSEQLLRAFRGITLTVVEEPLQTRRHVTPLSLLQQRILHLLGFSPNLYARLATTHTAKPP